MGRVPTNHSNLAGAYNMTTPSTPSPSRILAGPALQKRARATRQHSGIGGSNHGFSASPSRNEFEELKAFLEKAVKAQMDGVNSKLDNLHQEKEELRNSNQELQGELLGLAQKLLGLTRENQEVIQELRTENVAL